MIQLWCNFDAKMMQKMSTVPKLCPSVPLSVQEPVHVPAPAGSSFRWDLEKSPAVRWKTTIRKDLEEVIAIVNDIRNFVYYKTKAQLWYNYDAILMQKWCRKCRKEEGKAGQALTAQIPLCLLLWQFQNFVRLCPFQCKSQRRRNRLLSCRTFS